MKLKVRTFTADNMFFGPQAQYATVVDGDKPVKEFAPPFARLQAWWYVIRHFGG